MAYLLEILVKRGDKVCIENGRLIICPRSGDPVTEEWLKEHSKTLLIQILQNLGMDAYEYDSYDTGKYGFHKADGVALQLPSVTTGLDTYAVFNASLKRERTTKAGEKGSPLPPGQFHIGERSQLYRLWQSTGLPFPRRLSALHDYMGKLRGILFAGSLADGHEKRLDKGSLRPLNIAAAEISKLFEPDNLRTSPGQTTDNFRTRMPDKNLAPDQRECGAQPNLATGVEKHGKAVTSRRGYTVDRPHTHLSKRPEDQTTEEWLERYFPPDDEPPAFSSR